MCICMCATTSIAAAMTCCCCSATISMASVSIVNWTGTWQTDPTMTRQTLLIVIKYDKTITINTILYIVHIQDVQDFHDNNSSGMFKITCATEKSMAPIPKSEHLSKAMAYQRSTGEKRARDKVSHWRIVEFPQFYTIVQKIFQLWKAIDVILAIELEKSYVCEGNVNSLLKKRSKNSQKSNFSSKRAKKSQSRYVNTWHSSSLFDVCWKAIEVYKNGFPTYPNLLNQVEKCDRGWFLYLSRWLNLRKSPVWFEKWTWVPNICIPTQNFLISFRESNTIPVSFWTLFQQSAYEPPSQT